MLSVWNCTRVVLASSPSVSMFTAAVVMPAALHRFSMVAPPPRLPAWAGSRRPLLLLPSPPSLRWFSASPAKGNSSPQLEPDSDYDNEYWGFGKVDNKALEELEQSVIRELGQEASPDSLVKHMGESTRATWFEKRMHSELALGLLDKVFLRCLQMKEHGVRPSLVTYNCIFRALNFGNRSEKVEEFFTEMVTHAGLAPNTASYRLLLDSYIRSQELYKAIEVVSSCQEQDIYIHLKTYHMILQLCERAGDGEATMRTLMAMKQGGVKPTVSTYIRTLKALIAARDLDAILNVIYEMEENEDLDVPKSVYERVLTLSLRFDSLHKAMHCYRKLRESGEILPECTYIALGKMAARHRMGRTVDDLLRSMKEDGWQIGVEMYTAAAEAHAKAGAVRESIQIISVMVERGLRVSPNVFFYLTKIFERDEQRHSQALNYCYSLNNKKKPVPEPLITCLLRGALAQKNYDQVFYLFEEITTVFGHKPSSVSYNCLILAFIETGAVDRGVDTLKIMREDGITPNRNTYVFLIRGVAEDNIEVAVDLLQQALDKNMNVHVNLVEFLCLRVVQTKHIELLPRLKELYSSTPERRGVWHMLLQKKAIIRAFDMLNFDGTVQGTWKVPTKF